jgi:iron(III) transport system permease protein
MPVAVGFIVPLIYLGDATLDRLRFAGLSPLILAETVNTLTLAIAATIVTVAAGVAVVYAVRASRARWTPTLVRIASLGYAVPGTVLAIGLLPVVTGVEAIIDDSMQRLFGVSTGLVLLGTGVAVVYAYFARFLAVAAGAMEAGFNRVSPSLDDAARTLGETAAGRLRRVYLPLTRPALATAALLVFVDCMKELPATLLLRPLGFETLATHLYGEAVRGTYEDAAIAALLIVVAGLAPVILLARVSRSSTGTPDLL